MYFLQHYWWGLISLLGGFLAFLTYIQGGATTLFTMAKSDSEKSVLINAIGKKWGITFTTLVVFGGALFASFPLYYATSFGGAYWLWMAILFLFVIQAVSYEYRSKAGNLLGQKTYELFLLLNGTLGVFLLGVAIGTFFTGGAFIMEKSNIATFSGQAISRWSNGWHGLDALANPFNLLTGLLLLLIARYLGLLYIEAHVEHSTFSNKVKNRIFFTFIVFLLLFVSFLIALFTRSGYSVNPSTGAIELVQYKYLSNLLEMVWPAVLLVVAILSVWIGFFNFLNNRSKGAFWATAIGVILSLSTVLMLAAFNNTAFFVSTVHPDYSLTLYNASSSYFTLKVMSYVSLAIPIVIAYIAYVWKVLTREKVSEDQLKGDKGALY